MARDIGATCSCFPDGTVRQKKGSFWMFGGHTFQEIRARRASRAGVEVIVVGIGNISRAELSSEAKSYAEQAKLELHILPSDEAMTKFNRLLEQSKKVAALIHITC